jgi:AraC-like DNA-binding protein
MHLSLLLDQPDLIEPQHSRRLRFGQQNGARVAILNARGARYEGGGDDPELSLKWIPQGEAHYRSQSRSYRLRGDIQLLLNRAQPYALEMREPSESFVVFFDRRVADAAWSARVVRDEAFGEVPSVARLAPAMLRAALSNLRRAARAEAPYEERLAELALGVVNDVVDLALEQRAMLARLPSMRRTTREELLRRLARAESYLVEARQSATLRGAADAAALSPFHLIRVFRHLYGQTPLAWAIGKRLEAARNALRLTYDSIEEIASLAGYQSRTAFDRAFQRHFGDTPGRIRARR